MVPPEITVRNKVPSENILAGTLFLTVISHELRGNIFFENSLQEKQAPTENT
jgi:hypothetical protein